MTKRTPMANQTSETRPQSVTPDSLTAAERAVLFNIETHTEWSDSRGVAALFEKGLVTRSNGRFALTDPVSRYLPEFAAMKVAIEKIRKMESLVIGLPASLSAIP